MASLQQFTIGVEEEYMILDPSTKELKSHQRSIVNEGQKIFQDKITGRSAYNKKRNSRLLGRTANRGQCVRLMALNF